MRPGFENRSLRCAQSGGGRHVVDVRQSLSCDNASAPLSEAASRLSTIVVIDIWRCDASGIYSGYNLGVDEPIAGARHTQPDNSERACRGALRTDKDGIAEFNTIYPGYYVERATHIHFKAHIGNRSFLTNQAYLPEEINEAIYRLTPYNAPRKAQRILNTDENWSVPTMKIIERKNALLAVLNLAFVSK